MRWKTVVAGLVLGLVATVGCKQQCFLTECDYDHYRQIMPANLECDLTKSVIPSSRAVPKPATVLDSERPARPLSLQEAIAMSLENGTIGSPTLNGTANLNLATFAGRAAFTAENSVRVIALDPAVVGADIEASLAKFDARWTSAMNWSVTDQPTGSNALQSFQNGDHSTFNTALLKPLPTGGVAGITFRTDYQFLSAPPPTTPGTTFTNPAYRPSLQFQFEQPLLQGYGIEINQLRNTHPGSVLTPFPVGGRVEGILITRLRFDEQRAEFQRNVNTMLVNVEVAYWNLYGSYWNLYSREQALRQAFEAWKINRERYNAGRIPVQELAQTQGQYELFRAQRVQALEQVLENERALRLLIGLPVEDGTQIVPTDVPNLAPYVPDWDSAVNDALALRPELTIVRDDLKFRQLDLINQKNLLLPDLRVTATYDINGIGTRLDGATTSPDNVTNAFHSLATDKFNDWNIGIRWDVPLGFRDAHSAVRAARLNLARSYQVLLDQENRAQQFLALQYSNLVQFYEVSQAQHSQRLAAAIQLDARSREFLAGRGTLDFLLEAQRVWADALRDEYNAIVQYNNAMATFEFARGTILQHDNVTISEGYLPKCAQIRAVDHARERSKAIVLAERAKPVCLPSRDLEGHTVTGLPELPDGVAPPIPSIQEGQRMMPRLPETLPLPRPQGPTLETLPVPREATPGTPQGAGYPTLEPGAVLMTPAPAMLREVPPGRIPNAILMGDGSGYRLPNQPAQFRQ
jgi:outer membrane protein TolC